MKQKKFRMQIKIELEQHDTLVKIAHNQSRSLSDLVREILHLGLEQHDIQRRWEQQKDASRICKSSE